MTHFQSKKAALLCLFVAVAINSIVQSSNAAVLPRMAPLNVQPMQGDVVTSPTPLPVVSTYTLYFGNGGSTTTAPPLASQTVNPPTSSAPTSTSVPPRSTSSSGKCSKNKHTSAPAKGLASTSVGANKSSATTTSPAQQNTVFPTVAPAAPTSSSRQRASIEAGVVLPHSFVNKVDALVETYDGITGRKARQLALILSNQTSVVANTSRTQTILSNLAEAYPSNNDSSPNGAAARNATLFDWTTDESRAHAANSDAPNLPSHPHRYVVQAGRSNITLLSNTPDYGPDQVRHDLHVIRKWAGDLDQLSTRALLDETVAAIMSAAARYYPELSTRDAARVIMADIKAESDFDTTNVSGGRLDSGSSWGLLQVSPFGSRELALFQQHATVRRNTYSWSEQYNVSTTPRTFGAGALLDWNTGDVLDLHTLRNEDLFRAWINVHVATWIQSNLARTASQDPYSWPTVYAKSNAARNSATTAKAAAWSAVDAALVGAGLPRSFLTALGSWVAGPAVDGYGSYTQPGDDVSRPYFQNIAQGLSVLYNATVQPAWLNTLTLRAGLVDFH
ncbi:uncharacterized protein SRS1_12920 [Sporisorium reilianum f. sp. reilianum]|uniref:Transglycosylase SLT domain-containing protein n=1 Tax=Sporisorium reilianum f. sp. reilianum TaxID=72559 RepID=A0A2N8UA68_9BASI|nr:uncharacterized protein SRS1_12920 [Sporisorium reilianum f. sp. reilianum]